MDRRKFIKSGALIGAVPTLTSFHLSTEVIKPKALKPGASIGVIAPSGALKRSDYETLMENFHILGYPIIHTDNLRVQNGFLAGTDAQKIEDLHHMYENPEVSAIFCARGGYGATRLLEKIDYSLISINCKPLIGYSDITALHLAIYKKCGIVGFHGPVGISTFNPFSIDHFNAVIQKGNKNKIKIDDPLVITPGIATGKLI
jgi:muramoyltetrapeptide carboxypeptidase